MLFARDMSQFVGMLLNEGKIFCKVENAERRNDFSDRH